jgi:superfamily II DNA or RNA helicase
MNKKQIDAMMKLTLSLEDENPDYLGNSDLLNNMTLAWFQSFCVEHCFISKGSIISLDTGLGKTMTAMAYMVKVLNNFDNHIGIFFCLPESIEQCTNDFKEGCSYKVIPVTGESDSIGKLTYKNIQDTTILVCSYKALYSIEFANWFVKNNHKIKVAVFDEAHELSNKSLVNSYVKAISGKVEFRMALTATPITTSPKQIISLIELFDSNMIPGGQAFLRDYEVRNADFELIDYKHLDNFSNEIYPRYVSWTRSELGLKGNYHSYVLEVEPTPEQKACSLKDAFQIIKGNPDSKQAEVFYRLVKYLADQHKVGLCYAYNRDISEALCSRLRSMGIRAFVVNGDTENKKIRQQVIELFHHGEIDIIITNLTMSLNLACDYLIFWQFTNRSVQMLGRCVRGFMIKDLEIYIILTKDTVEVEQYQENVYKRCKWLEESLGKDVETFREISRAIEGG